MKPLSKFGDALGQTGASDVSGKVRWRGILDQRHSCSSFPPALACIRSWFFQQKG
jgi:hypothetical protein